jgi:hypothetical protein
VINQTERQKQAAKRQTKVVEEAFSKAIRNNNSVLAIELKMAAQHYQNLGLSAEKAGQMQLQAAKVAAKGQLYLAKQILDTQEKHILAANAALDHGKKLQGLQNKAMLLGGTLTGLGVTVQMLSDDTESFSYKLAGTAVNAGITIGAIGTDGWENWHLPTRK